MHVFHDYPVEWSEAYQTKFSNALGMSMPGMVQTKTCTVCGKVKWRHV